MNGPNKKRFESGASKRKRKAEEEQKIKLLPSVSKYFIKNSEIEPSFSTNSFSANVTQNMPSSPLPSSSVTTIAHETSSSFSPLSTNEFLGKIPSSSSSSSPSNNISDLNFFTKLLMLPNPTDIGHFSHLNQLPDAAKKFIVEYGPCQPKGPFYRYSDNRVSNLSFNEKYYYSGSSMSGGKTIRLWLSYSIIRQVAYCQPCTLFGNRLKNKQTSWIDGFDDWDHITIAMNRHESSTFHLVSCKAYNMYHKNLSIDCQIKKQDASESEYWTAVLTRIIDISITLGGQNLSFRGHREDANFKNNGNFMALIRLLAKYDPILATLLEKPKGSIKYLSHQIQNQIIALIESEIKKNIISDVTSAPFFSLILDSTQDISKVDQVSTIYRYVHIEKDELGIPKSIEIKEDFIGFSEAEGSTGEAIEEQTVKTFKDNGLDIGKFRGIGLDGAASMSGKHNGLQARLRKRQKKAKYVHCASHNLNLVINDSVKDITEIRQFFEMLETLYTFFGNSILRWAKLKKESCEISRSLKRLCPTRWSSRTDCLISLNHMYPDVMKVLNNITLTGRNKDEQNNASTLKKYFESYETIILILLMYKILSKINLASKILQSPGADIGKAVDLIKSTLENMGKIRDNFNILIEEANSKALQWNVTPEFSCIRTRKVKKFYGELCQDKRLSEGNHYFKTQVLYRCIDTVVTQLKTRFVGLSEINDLFSCILRPTVISDEEIGKSAKKLAEAFEDFNPAELTTQIESFKFLFASELKSCRSVFDMTKLLIIDNNNLITSFPDLLTAFYLFLTLPVTVASAERTFSKLKLIKNYLRSTMCQTRLSGLAMISIENERAKKLNLSSLVKLFSQDRSRKKSFQV
ncbi:zinc finger MYM-type protein 1-like [Daktulosphaira vitifoliae]|uniref:zinc finger MYM-type protein 1-like n=1 Tax=Daktulosphaira vitifoliae TaxID=58002 RepID=UPI0021AA74EE|nr:zinc finger MYM-type protein 1-like [Daktulosphaira vitifoliae]XP_050544276.1 zinc finger MYM-type protein 1-like [Daktulosphaira vitifoliae]